MNIEQWEEYSEQWEEYSELMSLEEDFSMPWIDIIYYLEKEYWA